MLISAGEFAGEEGVCLGVGAELHTWAVSPNSSNRVLALRFPDQFGILINPGQCPGAN